MHMKTPQYDKIYSGSNVWILFLKNNLIVFFPWDTNVCIFVKF